LVLAEAGEDEVLYTEDGQYAANVEKAVSLPPDAVPSTFEQFEKLETPNTPTIDAVANFLKCSPTQIVKNVFYNVQYSEGRAVVLVSIRGDQAVNEVKLQNCLQRLLGGKSIFSVEPLDTSAESIDSKEALPVGYIAPSLDWKLFFETYPNLSVRRLTDDLKFSESTAEAILSCWAERLNSLPPLDGLHEAIKLYKEQLESDKSLTARVFEELSQASWLLATELRQKFPTHIRIADRTVADLKNFITGSNETGCHTVGANWGEQFDLPEYVEDVREAKAGDRAVHDPSQTLHTARGIEIGHIFQLGQKYSQAMGATYTAESGEEVPLWMGCYGVGVSRLAQSAVEQSHDENGIIWPIAIAPYHAIVVVPNISDEAQMAAAEKLYADLNAAGVETLLDDRNERAGVKFKDSELVGIPFRIVTGRSLKDGKVEVVQRATKASQEMAIDDVVPTLKQWVKEA